MCLPLPFMAAHVHTLTRTLTHLHTLCRLLAFLPATQVCVLNQHWHIRRVQQLPQSRLCKCFFVLVCVCVCVYVACIVGVMQAAGVRRQSSCLQVKADSLHAASTDCSISHSSETWIEKEQGKKCSKRSQAGERHTEREGLWHTLR